MEIELEGGEVNDGEEEASATETNHVVTDVDGREELGIAHGGEVGERAAWAHQQTAQVDETDQLEVRSEHQTEKTRHSHDGPHQKTGKVTLLNEQLCVGQFDDYRRSRNQSVC